MEVVMACFKKLSKNLPLENECTMKTAGRISG